MNPTLTVGYRTIAGAAVVLTAMLAVGCRSKEGDFYTRVHACDIAATTDVCGTTADGQPMTCHSVSQLGGTDFCAPACAGDETLPDGTVCVSGALIATCDPRAASSCPAGLSCYRTDLLSDQGLCLNLPVCKTSGDCSGGKRTLCAGDLVKLTFPGAPLTTENLHCVQFGCKTTGTDCLPGESCLPVALPVNAVPDICVPNCDANMRCPPNFVCSRLVSGPASPPVCLPGLPGARCAGPQDCLVGACEDSEAGFNICSIPCEKDTDCAPLISTRDPFVCVHRPSDGVGHCVSSSPFSGSPCLLKEHCPPDLDCYMYSAYQTMDIGECRLPCGPSGECPARGGLPHVCLANGAGGCYPGRFGLPCADTAQCMANFTCETVTDEITVSGPITHEVCTTPCTVDADCDTNPWTQKQGYCAGGFCQLGGGDGAHCERDAHCRTRRCQLPPAGTGTCLVMAEP
jgi:hypothetical protein